MKDPHPLKTILNNGFKQPPPQLPPLKKWIHIDAQNQTLRLIQEEPQAKIILQAKVSTAKNGLGEQNNSFKTPRGWHIIRAKIGDNHPKGAVFSARRWTGEIYSTELEQKYPQRDWILTRILWLSGIERGFNRLGEQDFMERYIYIHGTNEVDKIGAPHSHGCIRMLDDDLIDLFKAIKPVTPILIE